MHANEQLNTIVIRDQPEKLEMAEKIILANDRLDSEVLFDVEVLEVDRTVDQTTASRTRNKWPRPWCRRLCGSHRRRRGSAIYPPTIVEPRKRQLSVQASDQCGVRFLQADHRCEDLGGSQLRVVNNKKAEINIGDKQPILLSTTNVLPGQAATGAVPTTSTVTSIEFRDTGVELTVEPAIHLGNELSLKMKIEVIRLGEQVTLQANPPITQFKFGNRSAETMLNVKDGEQSCSAGCFRNLKTVGP